MQILGKRSKILLISVAVAMLVAVGVSFAAWDSMSAVKASNGDLSNYANAKVGDIITFGQYYQTLEKDENGEYIKTPIEWIVVDKDERTGQLTLMSKYILACGSYFGNWYYNADNVGDWHYNNKTMAELDNLPFNQAYVDSTVRAYLNNLERLDMGGEEFSVELGYLPSAKSSDRNKGLLTSIGYSNQRYWTGLRYSSDQEKALVDAGNKGFYKRHDSERYNEIYFQRPIDNNEYKSRPMTRGFYDEAFTKEEKTLIVPKAISGDMGYRWPNNSGFAYNKKYIEGTVDKVWLPSVTELNIAKGVDWNKLQDDAWTNPSDEAGSTVFEYFKNYANYSNPFNTSSKNESVSKAIYSKRTKIAENGMIGNYSIPLYNIGTTIQNTDISESSNSSNDYWTRSGASLWYDSMRIVNSSGNFYAWFSYASGIGVRPCVILKY